MNQIDPKILGKIKKCLALSSSNNPSEAAIALRQAHALMDKHGISIHEIRVADIGEAKATSRTMSRDKPAHWETHLAVIVSKAFGCQTMMRRSVLPKGLGHENSGFYIFVGLKHQAEIAAYTATVLIRKCKAARQQWLSDNFSGLGRGIKGVKAKMTRMGDMFAEGWVASIGKLVADFANPPEIDAVITRYIADHSTVNAIPTRKVDLKDVGRNECAAAVMGMQAAKGESLHRPMETSATPLKLGSIQH
jgi:hypothetical protein